MTFFERFEADILSCKKTITIRDELEKDYAENSLVQASTYEDDRWFCALLIKSVEAICLSQLSEFHAEQENMTLSELQTLLQEIYPDQQHLYVISYELAR